MTREELYNISAGIFFTFKNHNTKYLSKKYNHSETTRARNLSSAEKFLFSYNKATLVVSCLLCNFKLKPKSLPSMFANLSSLNENDIKNFRDEIKYYNNYFNEDMKYINENRIRDINVLFNLYIQKKIKFYTLYYVLKKYNLEEKLTSRTFKIIWDDIKILMYFLDLKNISEHLSEN